ncbi:MAG: hypothetical protein VKN72_28485 [Nostocales cyanobacterium 94392]|nr:hypothetical protein [Nostocales cyanobacterium 94392]
MLQEFEVEETENQSNYPTIEDTAFTNDEQEAIKNYKDNLSKKLDKNRSVLKGLETALWGITSYSLSRWLILTSGTQGIGMAIASAFLINNIVNRDCLDSFRFDRKDGQNDIEGMGKLIKFGLSTLVTAFVIWSAVGDFLHVVNTSEDTYDRLSKTVEDFNKLPSEQQNKIAIASGLVIISGLYVVIDSSRRRR